MIAKKVTFKCCNTILEFHHYNMFEKCKCGACGFDMGNAGYHRVIGDRNLVVIEALPKTPTPKRKKLC